jgi:hypothetical protein
MWDQSGLVLQSQSLHFTMICCLGVTQNSSQSNSKSLADMSSWNVARTHPYAHPQHMAVVKHCVCLTLMWDQSGLGLQYQSPHFTMICCLGVTQKSSKIPKCLADMSSWNVARTHPYAHPQHMKVVKHLVYVWHWCEINPGWVYSVDHRISPWFAVAWELPRILAKFQKLGWHGQL